MLVISGAVAKSEICDGLDGEKNVGGAAIDKGGIRGGPADAAGTNFDVMEEFPDMGKATLLFKTVLLLAGTLELVLSDDAEPALVGW